MTLFWTAECLNPFQATKSPKAGFNKKQGVGVGFFFNSPNKTERLGNKDFQ